MLKQVALYFFRCILSLILDKKSSCCFLSKCSQYSNGQSCKKVCPICFSWLSQKSAEVLFDDVICGSMTAPSNTDKSHA